MKHPMPGAAWTLAGCVFAATFFTTGPASSAAPPEGDTVVVDDFSGGGAGGGPPPGWKSLEFPNVERHTVYALNEDRDAPAGRHLCARSSSSASGLYKELDLDLNEFPVLSWTWKVDGVLDLGDARKKSGDDYAARIYVTFAPEARGRSFLERLKLGLAAAIYGKAPPPSRAINYIWANRLAAGEVVPSPYTDRVVLSALRSGDGLASTWVEERRNVYEDYLEYFGAEAPRVTGLAVMTDSDNTGGEASACYDEIMFSRPGVP